MDESGEDLPPAHDSGREARQGEEDDLDGARGFRAGYDDTLSRDLGRMQLHERADDAGAATGGRANGRDTMSLKGTEMQNGNFGSLEEKPPQHAEPQTRSSPQVAAVAFAPPPRDAARSLEDLDMTRVLELVNRTTSFDYATEAEMSESDGLATPSTWTVAGSSRSLPPLSASSSHSHRSLATTPNRASPSTRRPSGRAAQERLDSPPTRRGASNGMDRRGMAGRRVGVVWHSLKQAARASRRTPVATLVGILSVAFTVASTALTRSITKELSAVFFRTAELEEGETDFLYEADQAATQFMWLNYTKMDGALNGVLGDRYTYSAPRFIRRAAIWPGRYCEDSYFDDRSVRYSDTSSTPCGASVIFSDIYLLDFAREAKMGLGREFGATCGPGEAVLDSQTARIGNIAVGDTLWIALSLPATFQQMLSDANIINSTEEDTVLRLFTDSRLSEIVLPVTVAAIVSGPEGKLPATIKRFVMLDISSFLSHVTANWSPTLDPYTILFANTSFEHYATEVYINVPPSRTAFYRQLDLPTLRQSIVDFLTDINLVLGYSQLSVDLPLYQSVEILSYLTMFLNLIIELIIFMFSLLSTLLLYSLVMRAFNNVSFDYGCLRMLGLDRMGLSFVAICQPMSFVMPGIALGVVVAILGYAYFLAPTFASASGLEVDGSIQPSFLLSAVTLAVVIVVAASALPVYRTVNSTLRDTLDVRRSKTKAVEVSVERTSMTRIPIWAVLGGAVVVAYGVMVYIYLPQSLVMRDLAMLLRIFFIIIFGMLFGLVVLSHNFEMILQRFVIFCFLCPFGLRFERPSVLKVLRKNLVAHRRASSGTTSMYSTGLAFVLSDGTCSFQNIIAACLVEQIAGNVCDDAAEGVHRYDGVLSRDGRERREEEAWAEVVHRKHVKDMEREAIARIIAIVKRVGRQWRRVNVLVAIRVFPGSRLRPRVTARIKLQVEGPPPPQAQLTLEAR